MSKKTNVILAGEGARNIERCAECLRSNDCEVKIIEKDGRKLINAALAEKPDAVVMDAFMANLDALGVLEEAGSEFRRNKTLTFVMSSVENPLFEEEVLAAGADYYFLKPFDYSFVADRVAKMAKWNNRGEETSKIHPLTNMEGLVFILDPIDGTMNFVKQKRNFASMIAVYYNNRPLLGYIYDIIRDELYWGGPVYDAVYCNDYQLAIPTDSILSEGLVQLCRPFVMNDSYGFRRVVDASAGLRMYGCAGLEFINVLTGRCIC